MTSLAVTQRWRHRRHSWRSVSEGGFDKTRYDVALLAGDAAAKTFVETHHYSRCYPAARLRAGLFDGGDLVGVAVFGIPMQGKVLTAALPQLQPFTESLELSRFVLLDQVPANAESWFLAQAHRLIAPLGIKGVVAFADPMPRQRADGSLLHPGHIGIIYQASNAAYAQRATPRTLLIGPDGRVLSPRAVQKIRAGEVGHDYAEQQLVEWGATPRGSDQPPRQWLPTALRQAGVQRLRHPGNHRYIFRLGSRRQRQRTTLSLPTLPYPKARAAG